MDMGVALSFVPEDRLGMGLVGDMDLTDNMMLRSFRNGRSDVYRPEGTEGSGADGCRTIWRW